MRQLFKNKRAVIAVIALVIASGVALAVNTFAAANKTITVELETSKNACEKTVQAGYIRADQGASTFEDSRGSKTSITRCGAGNRKGFANFTFPKRSNTKGFWVTVKSAQGDRLGHKRVDSNGHSKVNFKI